VTEPVYAVKWTPTALRLLEEIDDRRIRQAIVDRAADLANAPEKQGKALLGPLMGFRRVEAERGRYRIVYHVQRQTVIVVVAAVGLRKEGDKGDVYVLLGKLLRQGLITPPKAPKRRR
jgi:mRNA interferase RelE/StbE